MSYRPPDILSNNQPTNCLIDHQTFCPTTNRQIVLLIR
ncbi:hypothetical protein barba134A_phanotate166 [Rheinheimera phage vB_RspM_barba_13-4A]|nr:hypothetical protein barba129I_phanotate166 [Rheinheimera phage vB_RspM_barba_12-9I]QNO09950.1 hypothetical protein barba134A_phanotate166 [Rheinheimera phage vB_RspM_barba_13-4A]